MTSPGIMTHLVRYTVLLSLCYFAGCAAPPEPVPGHPESPPAPSGRFETPPELNAGRFVPAALMKGPHHQVADRAVNHGFSNEYAVASEFGLFRAVGLDLLKERIHEINTIAALRKLQGSALVVESVNRALKQPIFGLRSLITDPPATASGVPDGPWRLAVRSEALADDSEQALVEKIDTAFGEELQAFAAFKRRLAFHLGVDTYSANHILQREMNGLCWAARSSDLEMRTLFPAIQTAGGISGGTGITESHLTPVLRDRSPAEIRETVRENLIGMGVSVEFARAFTGHPVYTPRHLLAIADALARLENAENRYEFIRMALPAESEADVRFLLRQARMLWHYNQTTARITDLIEVRGLVLAKTRHNRLVLLLPIDFAVWSRPFAHPLTGVMAAYPTWLKPDAVELRVTGELSPKAREEVAKLGYELYEGVHR